MKRFFIPDDSTDSSKVILDRDESHHLTRVLRLQVGDEVELLNGAGSLFAGKIESLGPQAVIRIMADITPEAEVSHPLWVCQGDLKARKMDELIQRCTELGVQRFIPFHSSRSQGRLEKKRLQRRHERWQAMVKSACKQSGRLSLMEVDNQYSLAELLEGGLLAKAQKILLFEDESGVRLSHLKPGSIAHPVCLMFGPEGGFSRAEVGLALQHGWKTASLGNLILRAETATLAGVAITQHLLGNI